MGLETMGCGSGCMDIPDDWMEPGHSGRGVTQALCFCFVFLFSFSFNFPPLSFRCLWMLNASTFTDWSSSIFFIFTFKSKKSAGLPLIFSLWRSGVLFRIYQKAGGPRLWRVNGGNGALSSPEVSLLFSAGLWGHLRQATDSSSGNCCIIASEKIGWVKGREECLASWDPEFSSVFWLLFTLWSICLPRRLVKMW